MANTSSTGSNNVLTSDNKSNPFSRKYGGNGATFAVDPYITGYHFIKFSSWPNAAVNLADASVKGLSSTNAAMVLESSCMSVTIPGATLNKAEFTGLGGTKFFYPTNADWDNTVSMRFVEWAGAPVLRIIHSWVKSICDYRTGINTTNEGTSKTNFTGSMYYWTTRPDGITVNFYSLITGMFPMKDPTDQYGHDLSTVDKLELDIDFSCDTIWQEASVLAKCTTLARGYHDRGVAIMSDNAGVIKDSITY